MNLGDFGRLLRTNTKEHFPIILSAAAVVGTLSTVYLASKASWQAAQIIGEDPTNESMSLDRKERLIGRTKQVWKLYIPTAISTVSTITCIVGANRVEAKKTIAAQTAFAVSQRVFTEYRDKVIEEYGERKDQSIRDKIADDKVKKTAPMQEIVLSGSGNILCCEMFTGRYFNSDMETLRRAQNDINAKALAHDYATLDDFYYMVGIKPTQVSGQLGWNSDKQMELQFSTALTDDGRPCITFEYNYTKTL